MVKKSKVIDEEELLTQVDPDDELPLEVSALIEEFGTGFSVVVEKFNDQNFRERVGKFPADQFDPDAISAKYGGGKFQFTFYNAEGKYSKRRQGTYAKPAVIAPVSMRDDSQKETLTILRDELKSTKEDQKSTTASMIAMMTEVLKAQMANANRPAPQSSTIDEVVKVVSMLGLKDRQNPMENITSVMNLLRDGISMGKDMSSLGGGDQKPEDVVLMKLAEQLLPALGKIVGNVGKKAVAEPITNIPKLEDTPDISAGVIIPQQKREDFMYNSETERIVIETIKENSGVLIGMAKFNIDPIKTANIIDDKLTDDAVTRLFDYYNTPANIERTFAFIPDLAPHRDWFIKVLEELRANYDVVDPAVIENKIPPTSPAV